MSNRLYFEEVENFVLFPVVHHSYEFTLAAVEAFQSVRPVAVALEYPEPKQDLILRGISRLPRISVVVFGTAQKQYIRIEPVDPFVEVGRLALEHQLPVRCIDLEMEDYPDISDRIPDTYALRFVNHERYCRAILHYASHIRTQQDDRRECAMAFHLQTLARSVREKGPIMVLCGLSHVRGLKEAILTPQARPFEIPRPGRLYHLSRASLGEIMGQFPFLSTVYELQRANAPQPAEAQPSPLIDGGRLNIVEGKKTEKPEEFAVRLAKEIAFSAKSDRHELYSWFLLACREYYEQEIGERLHPQSISLIEKFSRKYAHVKGMLLPGFYELLVAGRSCVSSHFCYRMWEIGTAYAAQEGPSEIESIELRAEDVFPFVSKVRMNPHAPLKPRAGLPGFLRRREKQKKDRKQKYEFHPFSICSYQPEDVVIEDYGRYLRKKGKNMLSEERKRVLPFETSLLDGIDIRETIRNWHTGKIYVQECMTVKGSVDSLVVIYDEETSEYPYTITWLGEHDQESDMAFYATDPEERLIAPGIRKAIYGGFLMTMPPGRLFDVFHDPAYSIAENHAERLLLAAIDYGLERFVIYAAPKPPRPFFQVIAGRYGKRILYIPLAQLSPVMLQKVRTFHILADKSVRDYAGDYIWKD